MSKVTAMRVWPIYALLATVVLFAGGCVFWFMHKAMENERYALRQIRAEAYKGQLSLLTRQLSERWQQWLTSLDQSEPGPVLFERVARLHWADSAICFDPNEVPIYPQASSVTYPPPQKEAMDLQQDLQHLLRENKSEVTVRYVVDTYADPRYDSFIDATGRVLAANAEFAALESISDRSDPQFRTLLLRLQKRVNQYQGSVMPAAQRLFLMHGLQQMAPEISFPTLSAEELAALWQDQRARLPDETILTKSRIPDLWEVTCPKKQQLLLLRTKTVQVRLADLVGPNQIAPGVLLNLCPPGDAGLLQENLLSSVPLDGGFPGWRLALLVTNPALFDQLANQRANRDLLSGCLFLLALTGLAIFLGHSVQKNLRLANLKNDLVATVSHELKTPLTAMRALVDTLLEKENLEPGTRREYLELLSAENVRLSRLIDHFLTFSRLEEGRFAFSFAAVSPKTIIEGALRGMETRKESGPCKIETVIPTEIPKITADVDAMILVLFNLLDNAWKYSGETKRIGIKISQSPNGFVRFTVSDNGNGISRTDCKRVFQRFYQVDQRLSRIASGCGLGLSIVQSIVEAHRGNLDLTSTLGMGSEFSFEIPIAPRNE